MRPARLEIVGRDGAARAGVVHTARGAFTTPAFMPVGTRGAVRLLDAGDLDLLGPQVVLGNTYHLAMRPGAATVEALGGLHRFTGWNGHMLTDSGGFQVFSLSPKLDADGATFRSTYDGSSHRFTPEIAVDLQERLGADIQMVLDICTGLPAPALQVREAMDTTLRWAERARGAHRRTDQALFGIVQGGVTPEWRSECAAKLAAMEFDGYGIGGLSVGESRAEMLPAIDATVAHLPEDRPRYLMGVGDPISVVEGVASGVDMFDCVLPTRLARHGTVLSWQGRYQAKNATNALLEEPIDPQCACPVCARYSRGYLRHLLVVGEPTGGRLLTLHNVAWLLELVRRAREAILGGGYQEFVAEVVATWEPEHLR